MDDFSNLEKLIVRELSCRLCLCTDVTKLKPLSDELKRKLKRLFDVVIRSDDNLPKAICHDCMHQVSIMYLYTIKVDKTQRFLNFHKMKSLEPKKGNEDDPDKANLKLFLEGQNKKGKSPPPEQGDIKQAKSKPPPLSPPKGKKSASQVSGFSERSEHPKCKESLTIEEVVSTEKLDKDLLSAGSKTSPSIDVTDSKKGDSSPKEEDLSDTLDPVVLIDGKPTQSGPALDRQITLFYKMECCICHEKGFHFKSLMKHYKDRHGVPGYVSCCNKKFHYFYPKKIIEHMAYHLQSNIFMCHSCHHNFRTSKELQEHQMSGGRSKGKIVCPRCSNKYPTYRELGWHLITHRPGDKCSQCDYCGKALKHHHRKKTINQMEDVVLCFPCLRLMKQIEKQEKENKEKLRMKGDGNVQRKRHSNSKFREALDLSADESSTE